MVEFANRSDPEGKDIPPEQFAVVEFVQARASQRRHQEHQENPPVYGIGPHCSPLLVANVRQVDGLHHQQYVEEGEHNIVDENGGDEEEEGELGGEGVILAQVAGVDKEERVVQEEGVEGGQDGEQITSVVGVGVQASGDEEAG